MITPNKIHSILRKAGIEREAYTSKLFYKLEGLPPTQMDLDSEVGTRLKIREALEEAGVKIQPQVRRWITVDLNQEQLNNSSTH